MPEDRLTLRSQLSEVSRIREWLEGLATQYSIPPDTSFAMELCLEEVVSNIIRHGYAGATDRFVEIQFAEPQPAQFLLIVEDQARRFNPLEVPEPPAPVSLEDVRPGGLGILLLRKFADSLEYEALPGGNRLRMRFAGDTAGRSSR